MRRKRPMHRNLICRWWVIKNQPCERCSVLQARRLRSHLPLRVSLAASTCIEKSLKRDTKAPAYTEWLSLGFSTGELFFPVSKPCYLFANGTCYLAPWIAMDRVLQSCFLIFTCCTRNSLWSLPSSFSKSICFCDSLWEHTFPVECACIFSNDATAWPCQCIDCHCAVIKQRFDSYEGLRMRHAVTQLCATRKARRVELIGTNSSRAAKVYFVVAWRKFWKNLKSDFGNFFCNWESSLGPCVVQACCNANVCRLGTVDGPQRLDRGQLRLKHAFATARMSPSGGTAFSFWKIPVRWISQALVENSSSSFRWLQFMSQCSSPSYAASAFWTLATIPAFQIFDVCFLQLHFLFLARCLEVAGVVGLLTDRIEVRRFDTFNK